MKVSAIHALLACAIFTSCSDITMLGHIAAYDVNAEFKGDPVTPVSMNAGFESHSFAAVPHAHSLTPTEYAKSDYLPVGDVLPSISRLRIEGIGANDALGGVAFDFVSSGATGLAAIAAAGSGITPAVSSESEEGSGKGSSDIAEQIKRVTVDPSVIPIR